MRELDAAFATHAREQALALGRGLDFRRSEDGLVQKIANNLVALGGATNVHAALAETREAIEHEDWKTAREKLAPLLASGVYLPGNDNVHALQARIAAGLHDVATEKTALMTISDHEADSLRPVTRLLDLATTDKNWPEIVRWANAWIAINPLAPSPWRALLGAQEKGEEHAAAAHAGEVLLQLDPPDFASIHLRVARQWLPSNPERARRHVLQALEEAPRFRAAYELLATLPPAPATPSSP
jgi:hypothetical protein